MSHPADEGASLARTGREKQRRGVAQGAMVLAVALLILCTNARSAAATTLPTGFSELLVAGGIALPTSMALAPDGRLFVAEQGGRLRVIKDGVLLATPFVTLTVDSAGERGLLGVALDPGFAGNGFIYVYYTVPGTTNSAAFNRVSRFTAAGDVAAAGSEQLIVRLDNLSAATNHNGGAIHFGVDGKLYIAVGDNNNSSNAQTLANRHGKVLRINADGSIPADNPFFNDASGENRAIWALGLRNPFSFAVQPGTGRIFINDVGSSNPNRHEEVNVGDPGINFGWPLIEGVRTNQPLPAIGTYRDPIHTYNDPTTCAITGGTFYNPPSTQFPKEYAGTYFFADYCGKWIRRLDPANGQMTPFATLIDGVVDLLVGPDGSLYYLSRGSSAVFRARFGEAPAITSHPANQTVAPGQPATFSCAASGTAPLGYQWQRNDTNIGGATGTSYTLPAAMATDNGATFRCVVSNALGSATSNRATLTVTSSPGPSPTPTPPSGCPKPGTCPAPTPTATPMPTPAPSGCPKPGTCTATPMPSPTPAPTPAPTATPLPGLQPMTVSGTATVGGQPAVKQSVQAVIGSVVCGQATSGANGTYAMSVSSASQQPGCGTNGAAVTFRLGGIAAGGSATFASGGSATVNVNR